jgi:aminoglycoside phosphotransferase (APT) family kinase protein
VSPLVDEQRLRDYLLDAAPELGDVRAARRITSGSSNEIFELRTSEHDSLILRRPPRVPLAPTAHDMAREFRVLQALEATAVPHPTALHLCTNTDVIGAPFFVMTTIHGFHLKAPYPAIVADDPDGAWRGLALAFIDALADLANVDWHAAGLEGFGRPDGYLERQVGRWTGQLERYRSRPLPDIDWLASWLDENRPEASAPGIIHGDYQFLNVLFADDRPYRLAGIVDWEQSTIGDPLVDLGWTLALWSERGEDSPLNAFYGSATQEVGMPTRAELAARYAVLTGRDVGALPYYETLGLFKLACITEGSYHRFVNGHSDTALHADFEWIVPKLAATAVAIAKEERD